MRLSPALVQVVEIGAGLARLPVGAVVEDGLAIVRAVSVAHGGTVSVASVPGETRFTVRLPAASD